MATIDIFSRIELPIQEVFSSISNTNTLSRCVSPFFKLENLNLKNSKINLDTTFSQKCVFLELLQLFFTVKEIIPNEKILFNFNGLVKGTQCINLIEDESSCIIKEKFEFSLYNQFNFILLDFILSTFIYIDTYIRHLRLKYSLYKDHGFKVSNLLKELSTIRSYIVIDSDINAITSLFEDLNKFAIWISPFLKIDTISKNKEYREENEFSLSFFLPFSPSFHCKISLKEVNKIIIYFSSPIIKGKNIWSILACENELIIQNSIEIDHMLTCMKLLWPLFIRTFLCYELTSWNLRLKELAEKTNLSKLVELSPSSA